MNSFTAFRKVAFWEGVSYVLLLLAMILKYGFDTPEYVRILGSIHGFLFVLYMILALVVMVKYKKPLTWGIIAFLVSLVPLGTFFYEPKWKREQAALS